uniref:Uncharacterized protein n=1 Tax=Rhodnius prolixus TaxID=13249 RepID=T1I5X4_RHOPR
MFTFTLKLRVHLKYILKVLKLPDHRFPKIIAKQIIANKVLWWEECAKIGSQLQTPYSQMEKLLTGETSLDTFISVVQQQEKECRVLEWDNFINCIPRLLYEVDYVSNRTFSEAQLIMQCIVQMNHTLTAATKIGSGKCFSFVSFNERRNHRRSHTSHLCPNGLLTNVVVKRALAAAQYVFIINDRTQSMPMQSVVDVEAISSR